MQNCTDTNRSLYTLFTEQMLTLGEVTWCHHSNTQDVVILNEYDPSTGTLYPSSYVHVTSTSEHSSRDDNVIQCSCQMYNIMQSAVISQIPYQDQNENMVLDHTSLTCMHCRFYKDYLHTFRHDLQNISESTELSRKVKYSCDKLNNPVVALSTACQSSTTKFSVASEDTYSIVHVTFIPTGACYASCKNGDCCARMLNKKKVPKKISIDQTQDICGHIHTLYANLEVLKQMFPIYFSMPEMFDDCNQPDGSSDQVSEKVEDIHLQQMNIVIIFYWLYI